MAPMTNQIAGHGDSLSGMVKICARYGMVKYLTKKRADTDRNSNFKYRISNTECLSNGRFKKLV